MQKGDNGAQKGGSGVRVKSARRHSVSSLIESARKPHAKSVQTLYGLNGKVPCASYSPASAPNIASNVYDDQLYPITTESAQLKSSEYSGDMIEKITILFPLPLSVRAIRADWAFETQHMTVL